MRTWDDINPDDTFIFDPVPAAARPPRRQRWPRLRALLARNPGRHHRKAARP